MSLQSAIGDVLNGDGILFIGSGFSLGAKNLKGEDFLSGPGIANHFASFVNLPAGVNLEDAADAFVDEFGVDALIREVKEQFSVTEVQDYHEEVAKLPWKRVYTTNYDDAFEIASRNVGKRVTSVTESDNAYYTPKDNLLCIHFNGFIGRLDRRTINNELKLTDASYVTESLKDSEWTYFFRRDLKTASAVFFIGYSLYDLHIKKILVESPDLTEKSYYYLGNNPDPIIIRRCERYGNVHKSSTKDFASLAKTISKTFTPRDSSELRTLSVREQASLSPASITDQSFIDLMLRGVRNDDLIAESFNTSGHYYLERPEIEEIFESIDKGNRIQVICSDLGNGKSLLLDGIRIRAQELGYRVFNACDHNEGVLNEFEKIAGLQDKVMITIDGYQNWLDEIKTFQINSSDNAALILTARNSLHDVLADNLEQAVGNDAISVRYIDILDDSSIEWIIDTFDLYGLWGLKAAKSKSFKEGLIKGKYRSQFNALLLEVLSSPHIKDKLSSVTDRIKSKGENYETLLCLFIMAILSPAPSLDILYDIWGPEKINSPAFRRDPVVNEFISWDYYKVTVRSSILAEYILRYFADSYTIVNVLTQMMKRAVIGTGISKDYYSFAGELMRFDNIQSLLPDEGKRNAVIQYYEAVKELSFCKRNYHFWLQYAIASMVIGNRDRAWTYIKTARSLAEKKGKDTYMIDNHEARLLLDTAIKEKMDIDDALNCYHEARKIIERQIRENRRHYPYRVASYFEEFLNKYILEMDEGTIEEFNSLAGRILHYIDNVRDEWRNNTSIFHCQKAMNSIINTCSGHISKTD